MQIARYTANGSGVVPTFNEGYQYTINEIESDGIYTVELHSDTDFTSCSFLEYIDGKIWANVYTTDTILIIDPDSGMVTGVIDCRNLLPYAMRRPNTDVLNGIAFDEKDGSVYLTGKNWPKLFKISLIEVK